jgi:hypothetical protein
MMTIYQDIETANGPGGGLPVYPIGHWKAFDDSKLEGMDSSIGDQRLVEFLKAEVEEQIEGALDVFSLLFGSFSANRLKLSGVVRGCVRKLTWVTPRSKMSACERRF